MKKYDEKMLRTIYDKTNGRCHLCSKSIAFSNYGLHDACGGWEVDHSVPVSKGGTDHLNNLRPAHTTCNRSKQARSSRAERQANGRTRAPLSAAAINREKTASAVTGALAGGLLGLRLGGPVGFWIGLIGGAVTAYAMDPEAE